MSSSVAASSSVGHATWRPAARSARVRVIHRRTERNQGAAVMADHSELVVAEVPQERDHVVGHRSLRGVRVIWRVVGQRRLPVATQVGADDEERASELRRDPVPGRMRSRMTVQ